MTTEASKANIMIVDDARETLQLLSRMLYKHGYDVRPCDDGQTALSSANSAPPDLALIDVSMSGLNGYELCRLLKKNPATKDVPVLFISALNDIRNKIKGFEVGGVDYITKPFQFQDVLARIKVHLELSQRLRELTVGWDQEKLYRETIAQINDEALHHVVHDIRNPLHIIALNLSLVNKHLSTPNERVQGYLASIEQNLDTVNRIIGDCVV
ncbi:MAG: response regulator [Chloroflexota bacterium]